MSEIRFADYTQQLMDLAIKGEFTEFQKLINEMKFEFTEKMDKLSYWQACLYTLQGDNDAAINELQSTLDKGYWWNPDSLREESDLSPLKEDPRFVKLIDSCEELYQENKKTAEPIIKKFGNSDSDVVVIILHWRSSNIKDFYEYWLSQSVQDKYQLVFIQSSQLFAYNSYCWDDFDIAKKDIKDSLRGLDTSGKKIIIAGASQGALIAIDLLFEDLDVQGFISVVPAIKDNKEFEKKCLSSNLRNKKGFILTGTKDPYYDKTIELASVLNEKGIQTQLIIKDGLGHFFPDDFESIELRALAFLTD